MSTESNRLSASAFLGIFAALIIGTYIMPYLGSNSWVAYVASKKLGCSVVPFFIKFTLHAFLYVGMCYLAFRASQASDKKWLLIFPLVAAVFDLAPNLNMIPLVPTAFNALGIFLCNKEYGLSLTQVKSEEKKHIREVA